MLEKMAEMVREDAKEANDNYCLMPCMACDGRPAESERCSALGRHCPEMQNPDGSLMLARWAVLLVARALEKEVAEAERLANQKQMRSGAYIRLASGLMNLITEAKEAAHEA